MRHPNRHRTFTLALLGALGLLLWLSSLRSSGSNEISRAIQKAETAASELVHKEQAQDAYGKLPLNFEVNRGQTDARVNFLSRGNGYTIFLTPTEAVLSLKNTQAASHQTLSQNILRMKVLGANPNPEIKALEKLQAKSNYFMGKDAANWRTNIDNYARVRYEEVYPGVDLVYYGNGRQLEYDFVVAPGASYKTIELAFEGVERLELDTAGDLLLSAGGAQLRQHKPVIYQEVNGARQLIAGSYEVLDAGRVKFEVAAYDTSKPLVIDPVLSYSTYLGGSGNEEVTAIEVDALGNAYMTGYTSSSNFPTTPLAYDTSIDGVYDAFVTKLNASGSALIYSTYIGGSGNERADGLALDSAGKVYITGRTNSENFPTPLGSLDRTFNGGQFDGFVAAFGVNGDSIFYSTYLGGAGNDNGDDSDFLFRRVGEIAVDGNGNAYVTGSTQSGNFPTMNPIQAANGGGTCPFGLSLCQDVFVTKLNPTGEALVYSTYLGGSDSDRGTDIVVDLAGNAYVTGEAISTGFPTTQGAFQTTCSISSGGFVAKINAEGAFAYSSCLGGGGSINLGGNGLRIAVDTTGHAYVTGDTSSFTFPTTPGAFQPAKAGDIDAFVTKVNPSGSALVFSTYLGGLDDEYSGGIQVDNAGNVYVSGGTTSGGSFPILNPLVQYNPNATRDVFVTVFNPTGNALVYSTGLGGGRNERSNDLDLDRAGNVYAAGETTGIVGAGSFPTTAGAAQTTYGGGATDGFVFKIGNALVAGRRTQFDFDGDDKTDLAVWRPGGATWYIRQSFNSALQTRQFGLSSDVPVAGDYDGDGHTDTAVFRPSNGAWYIMQSLQNTLKAQQFGTSGDVPVPADYDGDGSTDIGVYRPSNGTWYILHSLTNNFRAENFGASADLPVPADFDGDGKADLAVFRPGEGNWYIKQSLDGAFRAEHFGASGDRPLPRDYDGDGKADITVFRPDNGTWYILNSATTGPVFTARQWGLSTDLPAPGDYNGDGTTDLAVFRPTNGFWYILNLVEGTFRAEQFGQSGDLPVPGALIP